MQEIRNYEVGFKFENDLLYADISAYYRDFTGLQYQQTTASRRTDRRATLLWLRVDGHQLHRLASHLLENFRFQVIANYLDGEYTDFDACFPYHQRRHRQWLRTDRRTATAAPARSCVTC